MKREKTLIRQIIAAIVATLSLFVALDVISLSGEQMAQIEEAIAAVLTVLVPLAVEIWNRRDRTPLDGPRDRDGTPLVRWAEDRRWSDNA